MNMSRRYHVMIGIEIDFCFHYVCILQFHATFKYQNVSFILFISMSITFAWCYVELKNHFNNKQQSIMPLLNLKLKTAVQ